MGRDPELMKCLLVPCFEMGFVNSTPSLPAIHIIPEKLWGRGHSYSLSALSIEGDSGFEV